MGPEVRQALRDERAALEHRRESGGIDALEKRSGLDDDPIEKGAGLGRDRLQPRLIEADLRKPRAR